MRLTITTMGLCASLFAGCASIPEQVSDAEKRLLEQESVERPTIELKSWRQVIGLIEKSDKLKSIELRAEFAKRERERFFRDLMPDLTVTGIFRESIDSLGSIGADSFLLFANGIVSVPNPVEIRARYLSYVMTEYSTQLEYELAYRESVASVYNALHGLNKVEREIDQLDSLLERESLSDSSYLFRNERNRLKRSELELEAELSRFLGASARWHIAGLELPALPYGSEAIREGGELVRKIAAARIVAGELAELGIAISALPRINASLSMPPLFRVEDGYLVESFDAEQMQVNTVFSYNLDLSGRNKFNRERLRSMSSLQIESVESEYLSQRLNAVRAAELLESMAAMYERVEGLEAKASGDLAYELKEMRENKKTELLATQIRLLVWNDKFFERRAL